MEKIIGSKDLIEVKKINYKGTCKVDTGAYNSSISIKSAKVVDDKLVIIFFNDFKYETTKYSTAEVKSSNGDKQDRYVIKLNISLAKSDFYSAEFTLANREKMKNPILIGRKSIIKGHLVDPHKKIKIIKFKTFKP